MTKVGFIGSGNMGSALIKAISTAKTTDVYIFDTNSAKAAEVANAYGAKASDNIDIAKNCDLIFLAVKPSVVPAVAKELASHISSSQIIVSMAAGVSTEALLEMFGINKKIIRIMPNTPVALGRGVVLWCTSLAVSEADADLFTEIMANVGLLDKIDEKLIDAASALSGCGPAFVYMFIEALADGAVMCGLPRDKAIAYAASTLSGAAEMVIATGKNPELLKDEVCSPGGSTIEGVHALDMGSFRGICAEAVVAAYEKTKQLGKK